MSLPPLRRADLAVVLLLVGALSCGAADDGAAQSATVELLDLTRSTGAILEWDPWSQMGLLRNERASLRFRVGLPWVLVDYKERVDIGPVTREGAAVEFTREGAERIATLLAPDPRVAVDQRVEVIMLDPGHGGVDPGATYTRSGAGDPSLLMEKDVVLDVGRRLHALLEARYRDKRIVLTRDADTSVTLEDRVAMANAALPAEPDAILFISIHANAAFRKEAYGYEVWVLPPEVRRELLSPEDVGSEQRDIHPILNVMLEEEISRESVVLADRILRGLDTRVGDRSENRGVRQESWFVVRNTRMPAVLVELGFVTNPQEAVLLGQEDYLRDLARGLYDGISAFIKWFESSRGLTQ